METTRAKVYVDGANMLYAQKKMGWNIDWDKLRLYLKKHWDVVEIRYYTGVMENDENMARFLRYLHHVGYVPITKRLKIIKIGADHPLAKLYNYKEIHKSNFDVEMTSDILLDKSDVKEVIFLSGDGDFNYLIQKLKDHGIKSAVIASKQMLAWELKFSASEIIHLEQIKTAIIKL